jgi:hypothetical protein
MTPAVAVVTDSTACLSPELTAGGGIRVVPLRVVLGGRAADEDTTPGGGAPDGGAGRGSKTGLVPAVNVTQVEAILRAGGRVGTASPSPDQFADAYAAAAAGGAEAIVSVHLSGRLSGTLNSASLAAASAPVPVHVVDSQSIGMGLGIAVLTAAAAAHAGAAAAAVAAAAASRAASLHSYFALTLPGTCWPAGRLEATPALPERRSRPGRCCMSATAASCCWRRPERSPGPSAGSGSLPSNSPGTGRRTSLSSTSATPDARRISPLSWPGSSPASVALISARQAR